MRGCTVESQEAVVGDWLWFWIGAAIVLAIAELVTPFLFFMISFAAGASAAAVIAGFDGSVGFQWIAFLVASSSALAVLVPIGHRIARAPGEDEQQGSTRWIGRVAEVLEEIPTGPHATGLVRLERVKWRAESDAGEPVPPGEQVEVIAVRGTRLVVAPMRRPLHQG
jgi:membrane protein implicated in regulation of membrane protease activity